MKITFLGTSHGFNEPGRFCSSAVVTVDGKHYVIDAGAPIMGLLPSRGFSYSAVAGIFITHNHSDHFLGLVEFIRQIEGFGEFEGIHVNVHVPEEFPSAAINIFNFGDPAGKPVPLPGGAHTRKDPGRRIDFITYPDPESVIFDDGKVKITAIPNMHIAHSHSFLIEAEGKRVVFSGDLKRDFPDVKVGFSDHVAPDETMMTLAVAYMMGAKVIEKHFTLDKSLPGNDHYHSGDPADFAKAIRNFRLIDTVLGSGEKTVLECEQIPRREARRSLVLTRDIKKGETIGKDDIMPKRPGTGISPQYTDIVVGRKVTRDLEEDTILTWDMI